MSDDLQRLIVVRPAKTREDRSYLASIFDRVERAVPAALLDWEGRVDDWCTEYKVGTPAARVLEVDLITAVYLFDQTAERVVLAYGISTLPERPRDKNRMRGFPDVKGGARKLLGEDVVPFDRGHFLSHATGGPLDMNLFPQRRDVNQGRNGWGRYRSMERYAAAHLGTFQFSRPTYCDHSWIPEQLEYGVLKEDGAWWLETFPNR